MTASRTGQTVYLDKCESTHDAWKQIKELFIGTPGHEMPFSIEGGTYLGHGWVSSDVIIVDEGWRLIVKDQRGLRTAQRVEFSDD